MPCGEQLLGRLEQRELLLRRREARAHRREAPVTARHLGAHEIKPLLSILRPELRGGGLPLQHARSLDGDEPLRLGGLYLLGKQHTARLALR